MSARRNPPMPAQQMRQRQADLAEVTAAIAAADLAWSAELGDPPSEPRYIQALARGAMRALPNLAASRETQQLRARDESVKALVRWWAVAGDPEQSGEMRWDIPQEGREALDALARAHQDGGHDR